MRVFIAFDLDDALLDAASSLVTTLRGGPLSSVRARWTEKANLHVTTRFVGEIDEAHVTSFAEIVDRVARGLPSPLLRATRLGGFPVDERARVLYAAVEDDGTMAKAARAAEEAVTALGYPAEERAYTAHLTLARLKIPADLVSLAVPVALEGRATALTLYRSESGSGGPRYVPLATRALTL